MLRKNKNLILTFLVIFNIFAVQVAGFFFIGDAVFIIACLSVPAIWLTCSYIHSLETIASEDRIHADIFWSVVCLSAVTVLVILVNQWADSSVPEKTTIIIDKAYVTYAWKNNREQYHISVKSPVLPHVAFLQNDEAVIDISYKQYIMIEPGRTMVTLVKHNGFLGLPWYESELLFSDTVLNPMYEGHEER